MFFFLRKLIEAVMLPIGMAGLLMVAGVVLRRRWLAMSGVVVLYVFTIPFVGALLLQPLEGVYAARSVAAEPNADAIVVLSGGIVRGVNAAGVQWGETTNRYLGGFDLAMAGKAKLLVFTGAIASGPNDPSQGAIMRDVAIQHGVAPERIFVTGPVLTTEDEARAVARIPGVHSVLLVTSAFHMPRAVLLFRAQGLEVTPFPTDQRRLGKEYLNSTEFVPVSSGLQRSESALREYYGLAIYHVVLFFRPLGRLRA